MSARIVESVLDLVGGTPLVRLAKVSEGLEPALYAKLEFLNPGGSVKDRIGLAMIRDAERKGLLQRGSTIVEPTSGNTGMGLALAAVQRGYRVVFTVPDKMSKDKVDLLRAVGAEVRVTPSGVPPGHPASYISLAKRIAKETPNSYLPNQYGNPANPAAHYATTGPEIWSQTGGKVDALVAGVGTGGTISGTGRYLKEKNPSAKIVGVDPEGSILASKFGGKESRARAYKVEGIGEDFVPGTLDMQVIDSFVTVSDKEAMLMTRRLAREEGILAGSSSGAAVAGALKASRALKGLKLAVVILPDTGRSYLGKVYNDDWMKEHGFAPSTSRRVRVSALLKSARRDRAGLAAVGPRDSVSHAMSVMARRKVSFLPVVEEGVQLGCLTPATLVASAGGGPRRVSEVMEPPLPLVDVHGHLMVPGSMLGGRGAVLVTERQKPLALLTAADVVGYIAKR